MNSKITSTEEINHSVLIVDDEKLMHDLISNSLDMPKIQFYHAHNGQEVYNILLYNDIDCIFMDFVMPYSSGVKVTDIIRKAYKSKKVYIIGMTGTVGGEEEKVGIQCGMNAFLRKPFDSHKLVGVFNEYLETVILNCELVR